MGYDRAITVFSPDGRILQVEYAKKAVDTGTLTIGITCKDGVVFLADTKRGDKLIAEGSIKKMFQLEDHVSATYSGYISDARILIKKCRVKAQQHKVTYGEEISAEDLAKYLADLKQAYTQYGGIRPFGVSILIGGMGKKGPQLFVTEPSGIYFQYKAKAVGMDSVDANKYLEKNYKENMKMEDCIKLGIQTLKKILGKEFKYGNIVASMTTNDGFKRLSTADLKKH